MKKIVALMLVGMLVAAAAPAMAGGRGQYNYTYWESGPGRGPGFRDGHRRNHNNDWVGPVAATGILVLGAIILEGMRQPTTVIVNQPPAGQPAPMPVPQVHPSPQMGPGVVYVCRYDGTCYYVTESPRW